MTHTRIGPQLPTSKRKREVADDAAADKIKARKHPRDAAEISLGDDSYSDSPTGPVAPPAALPSPASPSPTTHRAAIIGPTLPPTFGPTAPPPSPLPPTTTIGPSPIDAAAAAAAAAQDRRQPHPNRNEYQNDNNDSNHSKDKEDDDNSDDDDDDDDDAYGPALPSKTPAPRPAIQPLPPPTPSTAAPLQRDSWMLAPPTESDNRAPDPTRIKARKFATGRAAAAAAAAAGSRGRDEIGSIWTETLEEKHKRLADAVLGRGGDSTTTATATATSTSTSSSTPTPTTGKTGTKADQEAAAKTKRLQEERMQAYTLQKYGGKSLYEQHQANKRSAAAKEEDDPSKRAFDKDKDMALGGKICTSQRRELLTRAADFGSRFSKGSSL